MQTGKEYEGDRPMESQKKALQIRSLDGNDRQDVSFTEWIKMIYAKC